MKFYIVLVPSHIPTIPMLVSKSLTTITVNWTYPNISDTDGYVVNASSDNSYIVQQVNGSSVNQITLNGLMPRTDYNISVRAYQDILGPSSDVQLTTTLDGMKIIDCLFIIELLNSLFSPLLVVSW